MRGLLKYAFFFIVAAAIGCYFLLAPDDDDVIPTSARQGAPTDLIERLSRAETAPGSLASVEEEELEYNVAKQVGSLDGWRAFLAAHPNGVHAQSAKAEIARRLDGQDAPAIGSAATATLSPTDDEHDDGLSQRVASLASHAQSALARAKRSLLGADAPASRDLEGSSIASPHAMAASGAGAGAQPAPGDEAPATAEVAISQDESQGPKSSEPPRRSPLPSAGSGDAAGTQRSGLGPDEICQRDADRLDELRGHPSSDALVRFANELGCKKLLPQVVSLMKNLAPPPDGAGVSDAASSATRAETETAALAPPPAGATALSSTSGDACERDAERFVRLLLTPSAEEASRFAAELACEKLRAPLQRLMNSPDFAASARPAPTDSPHSNPLLGEACASERAALDRLRQGPSPEAAAVFWRDLKCEGLRPQVRVLLESLNMTPDGVGSAVPPNEPKARQAASDMPAATAADPNCRRETAELNRVRATPDPGGAKRFASTVTCGALRPQVARLLESFGE